MMTHKEKDEIICKLNRENVQLRETLEKIKQLVESAHFNHIGMDNGYSQKVEEIREIVCDREVPSVVIEQMKKIGGLI